MGALVVIAIAALAYRSFQDARQETPAVTAEARPPAVASECKRGPLDPNAATTEGDLTASLVALQGCIASAERTEVTRALYGDVGGRFFRINFPEATGSRYLVPFAPSYGPGEVPAALFETELACAALPRIAADIAQSEGSCHTLSASDARNVSHGLSRAAVVLARAHIRAERPAAAIELIAATLMMLRDLRAEANAVGQLAVHVGTEPILTELMTWLLVTNIAEEDAVALRVALGRLSRYEPAPYSALRETPASRDNDALRRRYCPPERAAKGCVDFAEEQLGTSDDRVFKDLVRADLELLRPLVSQQLKWSLLAVMVTLNSERGQERCEDATIPAASQVTLRRVDKYVTEIASPRADTVLRFICPAPRAAWLASDGRELPDAGSATSSAQGNRPTRDRRP